MGSSLPSVPAVCFWWQFAPGLEHGDNWDIALQSGIQLHLRKRAQTPNVLVFLCLCVHTHKISDQLR